MGFFCNSSLGRYQYHVVCFEEVTFDESRISRAEHGLYTTYYGGFSICVKHFMREALAGIPAPSEKLTVAN